MKIKKTDEGTVLELSMTDQQLGMVNRIKKVRIDGQLDALLRRPLAVEITGTDEMLQSLVKLGYVRIVQSKDGQGHALYLESDVRKAVELVKPGLRGGFAK